MSDAPPRPWKTLIVAKLDRVSRNALDTLLLLRWLRARGKRLVSVAEGIDTSNYGKVMGGVARAKTVEERRRITADGEAILADIDVLRDLPVDPGGVRWVATDRTWEQELAGLSPEDRRLRWLELGCRFAVQQRDDESWKAGWVLPEGWRDEMPEVAEMVPTGDMIEVTSLLDWTSADLTLGDATHSTTDNTPDGPVDGDTREGDTD